VLIELLLPTGHKPRQLWAAEVEAVADHVLEEHAAGERPVHDLGERELGLHNRDVVPVARPAVAPGEPVPTALTA
jgi:hypothetical protein